MWSVLSLLVGLFWLTSSGSLAVQRPQALSALNALYPPWKAPVRLGATPFTEREETGRRFQGLFRGKSSIATLLDGDKTYGEFPFEGFYKGIDLATEGNEESYSTFLDIGSGCGRLTLGAAIKYPFARCTGLELSLELHEIGEQTFASAGDLSFWAEVEIDGLLSPNDVLDAVQRCRLVNGDITSEIGEELLQNVDIVFCYSTTWEATGDTLLGLTDVVAANCRTGTRVITTDKKLGDASGKIEVINSMEVANREAGGTSLLYVHEIQGV